MQHQNNKTPLRSVSSQTILMQEKIQMCLAELACAPYGESQQIFAQLASHTRTCLKRMAKNLTIVSEETSSVDVAQQAIHALSHSTLLQRVWNDAEYYVSSVTQRAAAVRFAHEEEMAEMKRVSDARILELERKVKELTPPPMVEDDDEDDDEDNNGQKSKKDKGGEENELHTHGIVGRYTLDARDRNKRRQYSRTDEKLRSLESELMKWHQQQSAENLTTQTRLEVRQTMAAEERIRIKQGGGVDTEDMIHMTPASRHSAVDKFMHELAHIDEHGRALMLEELFMSFKGTHRVEAMCGMLQQVASNQRYLLLADMHNEMKGREKRKFLDVTLQECDVDLSQMMFEALCNKIPIDRRRELLHEQVDTLGTKQMMQIIQELIAESIGESSRQTLVDGLTSYLSPSEKRECIVNIIFGVTIKSGGHSYVFGEMLTLSQDEGDDGLKVSVTGVTEDGKLTGVSLVSVGSGYVAGMASCDQGGATFMLTPSTRSTQQSLLARLAVVVPKIKQMMESSSRPGSPKFS